MNDASVHSTRCPWCRESLAADAELCPACGFNRRTGEMGQTRIDTEESEQAANIAPTWAERWRLGGIDAFSQYELPLGLLVSSFAFILGVHLLTAGFSDLPTLVGILILRTLIEIAWTWAGLVVLEWWAGSSYGDWPEMLLKLGGIGMFWMALLVGLASWHPLIGLLTLLVIWPIILFFLLRWLFDLDQFWNWITWFVVLGVNWTISILTPFGP